MEMVERITSILHCIIQSYRIIQWNIRYLSSRDSIWLRYAGHDVTSSLTVPYFLPFFPPLEKGNFHDIAREGGEGGGEFKTILETHTLESMVGIICAEHVPSANLISSTSAGLLSHRSRYSCSG